MQIHRFVRQVEANELSEYETFPVIEALAKLDVGQAHIDVGRIAVKYDAVKDSGIDLLEFVKQQVGVLSDNKPALKAPQDVVLYGFGRIC
jgi:glyceraldehyde 3-phosphate dehydrogenase